MRRRRKKKIERGLPPWWTTPPQIDFQGMTTRQAVFLSLRPAISSMSLFPLFLRLPGLLAQANLAAGTTSNCGLVRHRNSQRGHCFDWKNLFRLFRFHWTGRIERNDEQHPHGRDGELERGTSGIIQITTTSKRTVIRSSVTSDWSNQPSHLPRK